MKKFFTSILGLLAIIASVNANKYYVDGSKADDTGNGQTWATAKQTIAAGGALGIAGDSIFIKKGTYSSNATVSLSDRNFYGGFAGTEASPTERAKSDLDGNGIVESWEFTNQTVLNFTLTNATGLTFATRAAARVFDGFKITGTQTASTTGTTSTYIFGPSIISTVTNVVFQNNIVSDVTVTNSLTLAYTQGSIMLITGNNVLVDNCLFDKNTVTLTGTATQNDYQQVPLIYIKVSAATARNVMQNCIVRNNQVTIDYSATGLTSVNNSRGLIVAIDCSATYPTTLKNTIIHNNDMTFIPKTGSTNSLGNAAAVTNYAAANSQSDSIINCTIAKNKGTKTGCAGLKVGIQYNNFQYPYVKVFNNVCYDNAVDGSITTTSNMTLSAGAVTLLAGGIQIANNYANGGADQIVENTTIVTGNVKDLAADNANASKGAKFTSPSTVTGYNTDASIASSKWTVETGSYLTAKGIATNNKTDKAGLAFTSTPTVGAYETKTTPVITWSQTLTGLMTTSAAVALTATSNAVIKAAPVTFESANTSVVSVSGSTLSVVATETASTTVAAKQAANAYYNAAADVSQNVTVTKDLGTAVNSLIDTNPLIITRNAIVANVNGAIQVNTISGQLIRSMNVQAGNKINLASGAYIIRIITDKGTSVHKVVM
ncbi:MAG: T9SS type A sorting domain-containing protein [Paludibacter sp.]